MSFMNRFYGAMLVCMLAGCNGAPGTDTKASNSQADSEPRVTVSDGDLQGRTLQSGVTAFLGVPYAASTGGENRWRPPQPVAAWQGVRDATHFGPDCLQLPPPSMKAPWGPEFLTDNDMSEDCLSLNIWMPSTRSDNKVPVLVWIHGGAFIGGAGGIDIYHGDKLAEQGIIVVTINYRLGVFGFAGHPELATESDYEGQYGLLDQVAAIKWVQKNIEAFGGDPDNVTVAGQSAGADSVHALMAHPEAEKLFAKAIAQSGSGMGITHPDRAKAESLGLALQQVLNADNIAAMRALPGKEILENVLNIPVPMAIMQFRPVRDGNFSKQRSNKKIPLLTGFTGNENSYFLPEWHVETEEDLRGVIKANMVDDTVTDAMVKLYLQEADTPQNAALQFLRDRALMSLLNWAEQYHDAANILAYQFDYVPPGPPEGFGSFHSSEIPYVFGQFDAGDRQYSDADKALSELLQNHWLAFIKSGKDKVTAGDDWPALASGQLLVVGKEGNASAEPVLSEEKIQLFEEALAAGGTLGMFSAEGFH